MAKPQVQKQAKRSPVELTVLVRTFAKKLFPDHASDADEMNLVEDFLYDLFKSNMDKTEDQIITDFEEQIEAAKVVYEADCTPERCVVMFERSIG